MLTVLLVIIVVGVLLWLACKFIPMEPPIKQILVAVAVIFLVLYLLQVFGILGLVNQPVPRVR